MVNIRKQATENAVLYESIRNVNIISLLVIETPRYLNFWRGGSYESPGSSSWPCSYNIQLPHLRDKFDDCFWTYATNMSQEIYRVGTIFRT